MIIVPLSSMIVRCCDFWWGRSAGHAVCSQKVCVVLCANPKLHQIESRSCFGSRVLLRNIIPRGNYVSCAGRNSAIGCWCGWRGCGRVRARRGHGLWRCHCWIRRAVGRRFAGHLRIFSPKLYFFTVHSLDLQVDKVRAVLEGPLVDAQMKQDCQQYHSHTT